MYRSWQEGNATSWQHLQVVREETSWEKKQKQHDGVGQVPTRSCTLSMFKCNPAVADANAIDATWQQSRDVHPDENPDETLAATREKRFDNTD